MTENIKDSVLIIIDKEPIYLTVFKSISTKLISIRIILIESVDGLLYNPILENILLESGEIYIIMDINDLGQKSTYQTCKKLIKLFAENKLKLIATITNPDYFIYSLAMSELRPMAFIVKSETSMEVLESGLASIFNKKNFYSLSVIDFIRKNMMPKNQLDMVDKSIIYFLSKGYKVVDLPDKVNLSLSAIEWRKRRIRKTLGLCDSKIETIVEAGRKWKLI